MPTERETIDNFRIYQGPIPNHNLIDALRAQGGLTTQIFTVENLKSIFFPQTPKEEEADRKAQNINLFTLPFDPMRAHIREALRAIVKFAITHYSLPRDGILDIGSGPSGEMIEGLLSGIIDPSNCLQTEINSAAVAENQRRHPSSPIREGSYLNLPDAEQEQYNMVTGLSCLDNTWFLGQAIREIRKVLKARGYLIHVQDLRPGINTALQRDSRPPWCGESINRKILNAQKYKTPEFSEGDLFQHLWTLEEEGIMVPLIELFRREIGDIISRSTGMEVIFNDWVTATSINPYQKEGGIMYSGLLIENPPKVNPGHQIAQAVVTIARKIH
ncbi:MAG: methyltransferase domain-containing protein [Candidatus Gracilibacteria bacterium]